METYVFSLNFVFILCVNLPNIIFGKSLRNNDAHPHRCSVSTAAPAALESRYCRNKHVDLPLVYSRSRSRASNANPVRDDKRNLSRSKCLGGGKRHECPYPVLKQNGSEMATEVVGFPSGIAEIKFNGAFGKLEAKRYCKIKCINGEWVGPLCLVEGGSESTGDGRFHPVLRSCNSQSFHSKFVLSHKNRTVSSARDFPHNSVVQVRCKRFGVFKLIGDAHLTCHNGIWKHRIPTCIPTSSLTNYTDESAPPSVLAKVTSGSASIEPTGELAVYPGSTVHLECLYPRSSGEPEWSWTSTYRTYITGWSIDAAERDWKFRLSIYYIKPQDTGVYTCSTPKGLTHSIILNVIEVHCDIAQVLTNDPNLLTQIQGSRLGQSTTYQCRQAFKLNGTSTVTCQASGIWSGYPPQCIPIVCPLLEVKNSSVKIVKQDLAFGGTATFECPRGQKLVGVATLVCLVNGEWSGKIPGCKEILCPPPLIPQNGKLHYGNESGKLPFLVGSTIFFSCKGNHKIVGRETIRCQESGVWSNPPPFCKVQCSHPGDPPQGRYIPRKLDYEVGDRISLACSAGYEPNSKMKPKCHKNGSWSDLHLQCKPKNSTTPSERKPPKNVIIISKSPKSPAPETPRSETTPAPTTSTAASTDHPPTPDTSASIMLPLNTTEGDYANETDFFYVVEERSGQLFST